MIERLITIAVTALATCIGLGAGVAIAQPTNNDYYASAGTELLRSVETYHLGPGDDKMRARQYESAFGDFKFILNYFPNHPKALLLMAQLCETWKSPTCQPEGYFQNAIARNPDVAGSYSTYGIYLVRAKKPAAAIEQFKRALAIDPDSVNANYNIALAYLDVQNFALANQHAQKAYAEGAGVPGLRDRLQRAGQWKPLPPAPEPAPGSPPATPGAGTAPPK